MIKKWFEDFEKELSSLTFDEGKKAVDYYKELYQDKIDAGLAENEIIQSFGEPKEAAKSIIENSSEEKTGESYEKPSESSAKTSEGGNPYINNGAESTENKAESPVTRQIVGVLSTVLVAFAIGVGALSLISIMLSVEFNLMTAGLAMVFHSATVAVGLIELGFFMVLLFPFIKASVFLVQATVRVSKRVYYRHFGRETA